MGIQADSGKNKHISIGLLAHVDAGKTTLAEGLLYTGGRIRKLGRVDHQDAFLDNFHLGHHDFLQAGAASLEGA